MGTDRVTALERLAGFVGRLVETVRLDGLDLSDEEQCVFERVLIDAGILLAGESPSDKP